MKEIFFKVNRDEHLMFSMKGFCLNDDDNCRFQETQTFYKIRPPYPKVITCRMCWDLEQMEILDLCLFLASLPLEERISNFMTVEGDTSKRDPVYELKSMVIFLGAHYFTIVRIDSWTWRVYDDLGPIKEIREWENLIEFMVGALAKPTLMFY